MENNVIRADFNVAAACGRHCGRHIIPAPVILSRAKNLLYEAITTLYDTHGGRGSFASLRMTLACFASPRSASP